MCVSFFESAFRASQTKRRYIQYKYIMLSQLNNVTHCQSNICLLPRIQLYLLKYHQAQQMYTGTHTNTLCVHAVTELEHVSEILDQILCLMEKRFSFHNV